MPTSVTLPTAALASLPYAPTEVMSVLRHFLRQHGKRLWREHGFVDAFCESATTGSTMLAGALYHLDCSVDRIFEVGDHTLIIGAVETVTPGGMPAHGSRGPLLYFDRTFHGLGTPLE